MDTQTWFNIAAVAGAAAWLVPLVRAFVPPKIRIVTAGAVEVGFTSIGPILNVTAAFQTARSGALVKGLKVAVVHQGGEQTMFRSTSLQEQTGSAVAAGSQPVLYQRTNSAVAIGLVVGAVPERKVMCASERHIRGYSPLTSQVDQLRNRLERAHEHDIADQLARSAEFAALTEFIENEFMWHVGSYRAELLLEVEQLRSPVRHSFSFSLTQDEAEGLRRNVGLFAVDAKRIISRSGEPPVVWYWAYPLIG